MKRLLPLGFASLTSACGAQNNGDIPPELLTAIERGQTPQADYPQGPTGGEVGEIADNRCIPAWQDPSAVDFDPDALKPICLSDFWDPDQADHKLLLVNTAAIWCQVCQVEYQGSGSRQALGKEVKSRHNAGLRVLGSLFQNGQYDPASVQDGINWAKAFQVDFPFGIDSKFEFGAFATADVQPLNMVVDTRSMKILLKAQDGEAAWAVIDALLAE